MDRLALEFVRRRKNISKGEMATVIGKCVQSYDKKERGETTFSDREKIAVTRALELSYPQFNAIFFDGELPNWNAER